MNNWHPPSCSWLLHSPLWRTLLAVCLVSSVALARADADDVPVFKDEWQTLHAGVRYLFRKADTPIEAHALDVDLSHPEVEVFTTAYEDRWHTVSEFAELKQVIAATNGGFWNFLQRAKGVTSGEGTRWPDGHDDDEIGFFAVRENGRAWISAPERNDDAVSQPEIKEAVSGEPLLVREGKVAADDLSAFEHAKYRHPRTAVGANKEGTHVYLIVVDGRQGHSKGMTLYELAAMFVELGAHSAINLDGGGSSAMFIADKGIVNSPSGGRWQAKLGLGPAAKGRTRVGDAGVEEVYVRGLEREVMNHIGVRIRQGAQRNVADHAPRTLAKPENEYPWQLGRKRELFYPAFYATSAGVIFWAIVYMAKKLRRKKK